MDDGSGDDTGARAAVAGAEVLVYPTNAGKGAALATGLRPLPDTQSGFRVIPLRPRSGSGSKGTRFDFETEVLLRAARRGVPLEMHAMTHPVGQMLAVMAFTVGGILHRFPKLRVAFLETGVGWLPFWLERLDEHCELTPEQAPGIDRKPSEYSLSGRCFIGADPDERGIAYVADTLGEDVRLYASDYYHWDCKFPDTVKIIVERTDLSESAKRRMFPDSPRRLYPLG